MSRCRPPAHRDANRPSVGRHPYAACRRIGCAGYGVDRMSRCRLPAHRDANRPSVGRHPYAARWRIGCAGYGVDRMSRCRPPAHRDTNRPSVGRHPYVACRRIGCAGYGVAWIGPQHTGLTTSCSPGSTARNRPGYPVLRAEALPPAASDHRWRSSRCASLRTSPAGCPAPNHPRP